MDCESEDFLASADFGLLKMMWDAMATDQSHEGTVKLITDRGPIDVDTSIAPLVEALNRVGVETIASCSGHGYRPGNVALRDGRELIIARDFHEARKIDKLFPLNASGETVDKAQENSDEVIRWAELLINQLPQNHEGRNSWLMNHAKKLEA